MNKYVCCCKLTNHNIRLSYAKQLFRPQEIIGGNQMKIGLASLILVLGIVGMALATEFGYIQVKCMSGVRVYLDDEIKGITTERDDGLILTDIKPGPHDLRLEKDGFEPLNTVIKVRAGDIFIYQVDEFVPIFRVFGEGEPERKVMEHLTGHLEIQTVPMDVVVEIFALGITAEHYGSKTTNIWGVEDIPAGEYQMNVRFENRLVEYELEIKPDETIRLFINVLTSSIYDMDEIAIDIDEEKLAVGFDFTPEESDTLIIDWALVTGGEYIMGCGAWTHDCDKDELPTRIVSLPEFFISTLEITNEQFATFLNEYGTWYLKEDITRSIQLVKPHKWGVQWADSLWMAAPGYENHPVVNVSWYGAREFCQWASEKTGTPIRLPTEAEWEYAARSAGQPENWAGMTLDEARVSDVAWNIYNSDARTHRVGSRLPNALGIHDMSGNVAEWCLDWYDAKYYKSLEYDQPMGPTLGESKVFRGGTYYQDPWHLRTAQRAGTAPDRQMSDIGFRVVREM